MRQLITLVFALVCMHVSGQIPKEMQGFWQFNVNTPGDWNGFHVGEDYIENYYQVYKIRKVEQLNDRFRVSLDEPNNMFFDFFQNEDSRRKIVISTRKDTLLCTLLDQDPDIVLTDLKDVAFTKSNWRNSIKPSEVLFFDNNVLKLGDNNWNIKWFGQYRITGEYRALVENNGNYQLLYFNNSDRGLMLVYDRSRHSFIPESKYPAVYSFFGNWYNPNNNQWEYGFFEDFAIVKGIPKQYKAIKKAKGGYRISFDDDQEKPLLINIDKGHIAINKVKYNAVKRFLPDYAESETTSFYDSKFETIDTALITGYIRGNTSNNPFSIELRNWLTGEYERFYGDIDSRGLFTIKVPLYNTSQAYMDWRRSSFIDVLTPGEKYFIYKDLGAGETIFYGDHTRFHNELARYNSHIAEHNINAKSDLEWRRKYDYEKALKDTAYLNLKLSQWDSLRRIDQVFISENNLSNKALYYIKSYNKFLIASDLMQKRFDLDRQNGEKFSKDYMDIVKEKFYDNNLTPLSLIRENSTFLTDYVGYKENELSSVNSVQHAEVISKLFNLGILSKDKRMQEYVNFKLQTRSDTTNTELDELANLILKDSLLDQEYQKIIADNADFIHKHVLYELFIGNITKRYQEILQGDLLDFFVTKNILSRLTSSFEAFDEFQLEESLALIQNDHYKTLIKNKNAELVKLAEGELKYASHLKNTDHLKESKDADKILKEILDPHKGKVVYLDFWGTWCGPCVSEMEYAPAVKKAFEDKDVVFIYLANRTPKSAWENFIKVRNLEGENVYHYNLPDEQQSMIERRLSISGFPTYMLFDRNGDLSNKQAPRPSELSSLTKEIEKLLLE